MRKLLFGFIVSLFLIQNAYTAIPNSFTNGTVADADKVNEDFTYFENKFSTTSGHHHDGTDSKLLTILGTITTGEWRGTIIDEMYGGTGLSSYASGDMVYATADNVLAKLAKPTNLGSILLFGTAQDGRPEWLEPGTSGYILKANGNGTNPSWLQTLPIANGGTGSTANANTAGGVVILDGSGAFPASSVNTTTLKTTTGEVSQAADGIANIVLPGGEYGFYPQTKGSIDNIYIGSGRSELGSSYITNIAIDAGATTAYAQQRYVTASGEDLWIFLLLDKTTKEIISAYQAPDHPAYGNGGDFGKVPHPFGNYDETKYEIVLVSKEGIEQIKEEFERVNKMNFWKFVRGLLFGATPEKSILTIINEEYKPNMTKEEVYEPLHSGKFITKDNKQIKEMVTEIAPYIKVKSLVKLTQAEKDQKELKRQQIIQKVEQNKQKEEQDKISAENKLKALGLNEDEVRALK